jgi:hypothetical protein
MPGSTFRALATSQWWFSTNTPKLFRRVLVPAALVIAQIVVAFLFGCGAALAQTVGSPPAGKARIVVFRPSGVLGSVGRSWPVKLDGQAMGDVTPGSFAVLDRTPGRHQLSLEMFDFPGASRHDFSAVGGRVYIFRVKLKDKAKNALQAGSAGGVIGYAIAASAYGASDKSGTFEFVLFDEAAGKKATSTLRQASGGK